MPTGISAITATWPMILAHYAHDLGYNAVELLPVMEHPLDDSWGYQVTGYYSVTSRFGHAGRFQIFRRHAP